MSSREHVAGVRINPRIIEDVHRLVNEHRTRLGLEPWDFTAPNTKEFQRKKPRKLLKMLRAAAGK